MNIKTTESVMEVSWFDDMSDGDTEYLGIRDTSRASTFEHCLDILQAAERNGFKGALLPNAYDTGLEPLAFSPLLEECDYFGKLVILHLPIVSLSEHYKQKRITAN